ncbi:TetR family transcriptional regulator [Cryptosporangium sp. NPDC048952]|uniref:TetR family transcriptional regulator n=1 Tax=Cryptosporangium sp. NPDC048952 TaxID=3363961 RepID=UPI00372478F8
MAGKPRDSARTRRLLLDEAKRRFARDGFAATMSVREIAEGAEVNVALISRYFTSKEGLFEACLADAVTELDQATEVGSPAVIAANIASRIAGPEAALPVNEGLLLLLRSSGDERADAARRRFLHAASARLAETSTHDEALLRAQIVLATSLGIALLRASPGVEPLSAATAADLEEPLTTMIEALLA